MTPRQVVIAAILAAGAALASWQRSTALDHSALVERLTAVATVHERTLQEPLAVLLLRTPVSLARRVAPSAHATEVVRFELAVGSAVWAALMFAGLRLLGCATVPAAALTVAGLAVGGWLWFSRPSLELFASLSILPALVVVAAAKRGLSYPAGATLAVAASAAISITNLPFGLLAAFGSLPPRAALRCVVNGAAVVFLLCGVQQFVYPSSGSVTAGHVDASLFFAALLPVAIAAAGAATTKDRQPVLASIFLVACGLGLAPR